MKGICRSWRYASWRCVGIHLCRDPVRRSSLYETTAAIYVILLYSINLVLAKGLCVVCIHALEGVKNLPFLLSFDSYGTAVLDRRSRCAVPLQVGLLFPNPLGAIATVCALASTFCEGGELPLTPTHHQNPASLVITATPFAFQISKGRLCAGCLQLSGSLQVKVA